MKINYEVLDKILLDLASVDDGQITVICREEIYKFVQGHDMNVFSNSSLSELKGIFRVSLNSVYTAMTGDYLPNIFVRMEFDA